MSALVTIGVGGSLLSTVLPERPSSPVGQVLASVLRLSLSPLQRSKKRSTEKRSMTQLQMNALRLDDPRADATWSAVAELEPEAGKLGPGSRDLMELKSTSVSEAMVGNLEADLSLDTVRNEHVFHAEIHRWLERDPVPRDVEAFNERVYDELFRTPRSDPWVGLVPLDAALAPLGLGPREALAASPPTSGAVAQDAMVADLRPRGAAGLEIFWRGHADRLEALRATTDRTDEDRRLLGTLDAIAGQKDALMSRLFWYTDIDRARATARATGKPIVSLRLLGRLDEELSCANSRFFRTVLYANPVVADVLRERFVLHWRSVRPVPKVTIDFGDGRVVEQTVAGNSAHYILDADGTPVDVLPGAYGPEPFLELLVEAGDLAARLSGRPEGEKVGLLRAFHAARLADLDARLRALLQALADGDGATAVDRRITALTLESETRHRTLHDWLASGVAPPGLDALAARVSAELFHVPESDPMLGLVAPDDYAAIGPP